LIKVVDFAEKFSYKWEKMKNGCHFTNRELIEKVVKFGHFLIVVHIETY